MPLDEREFPLNEVCRKIMVASNYDPHFSGLEDRLIMETKLFLARLDATRKLEVDHLLSLQPQPEPIPMVLHCPSCRVQHIDAEEPHKADCPMATDRDVSNFMCTCDRWTNPPHKSHLCHFCGHVWRPADVHTNGVAAITTKGSNDSPSPSLQHWKHLKRGSQYVELGRGEFQWSGGKYVSIFEGARLIAYQGEDGKVWFRFQDEFEDGRFIDITRSSHP